MRGPGMRRALHHDQRPLRSIHPFLTVVILVLSSTTASAAEIPQRIPETQTVERVAPGVEHVAIRREGSAGKEGADRWAIHALILDPSRVRLELCRALDEGVGTESASSMAGRHGALAAVNGGYFRTAGLYKGEPAGLVEVGGRVLSEPSRKRPGLAVMNGSGGSRAAVVSVDFRAEAVAANGAARAIDGLNRPREADELILFTPEFHRTTLTGPRGVEAVVVEGLVTAVFEGQGSRRIPENGFILSAAGKAGLWLRDNLRAGQTVELRTSASINPEPGFAPDFIIGGGPSLVREGKPVARSDAGTYDQGFSLKRHPRTAAGIRADGTVVLVTVDGRQPGTSVGMTIAELEALMIEFGSVEAINLDGGGSTTLVIKAKVVNSPSDASGERPVSDALLVFLR